MTRIRHIAISVPDPDAAARFYETTFGLTRVGETHSSLADGVFLTDGVVNIAFLKYLTDDAAGHDRGKDFVGVHHFGLQVEDLDATSEQATAGGATHFMDLPTDRNTLDFEKKFRDPFGVLFDLSHKGWTLQKR